jgi:hypothetical protein
MITAQERASNAAQLSAGAWATHNESRSGHPNDRSQAQKYILTAPTLSLIRTAYRLRPALAPASHAGNGSCSTHPLFLATDRLCLLAAVPSGSAAAE